MSCFQEAKIMIAKQKGKNCHVNVKSVRLVKEIRSITCNKYSINWLKCNHIPISHYSWIVHYVCDSSTATSDWACKSIQLWIVIGDKKCRYWAWPAKSSGKENCWSHCESKVNFRLILFSDISLPKLFPICLFSKFQWVSAVNNISWGWRWTMGYDEGIWW